MQALASFSDPLGQQGFHIHVDVLRVHHPFNFACLYVRQDALQALDDLVRVGLGDDALFTQHRRVGDGAGDVLLRQALVEGNGRMEIIHQMIGRFGKASTPQLHRGFLLVCNIFSILLYQKSSSGERGEQEKVHLVRWIQNARERQNKNKKHLAFLFTLAYNAVCQQITNP